MPGPQGNRRDSWGSNAGFLLAAIGSAVGLGNMWRFSYVAAEGGGAAFVLLYLGFVAFIGMPIMTSELVIGRMTKVSPVQAMKQLGGSSWAPLGFLFAFCGFGILSYYSVIAGWTMRYAFDSVRGAMPTAAADAGNYFNSVGTGVPAIITHLLFMGITIFVSIGGIKKGLERAALILMPLLFLILVGLALWATTLSGGGAGYSYYLRPQIDELLDPTIITSAAGQAFFSLSLGMGAIMTYASYLNTKSNLGKETLTIALSDFGVAFVAGLLVFPIIFHFGLESTIGLGGALADNTVSTLFITIPPALLSIAGGQWIVSAFFVMLLFAALTSAISLLEVVVSAVIDSWGWERRKAAMLFGGGVAVAGIPSALNIDFLAFADKLVGNLFLIFGGLMISILVGYKILDQADEELAIGMESPVQRRVWAFLVRYVAPPVLLIVLFFTVPAVWDLFKVLVGTN